MKTLNNKIYKDILLTLIMGYIYYNLEILYRSYSSYWMILVGGLCCFLVGRLNEHPQFYDKKMWEQCLIGVIITLSVEFISGMILNVGLGLNIWDYSDMKYNLYGQICPQFSAIWFMLMPLAIWVDDLLRWILFKEQKPTRLWSYYWALITLK